MKLRIGSRKSKLAVTQSEWVAAALKRAHKDLDIEFVHIVTTGDKDATSSLGKIGGKGVFVKEIEDALLKKEIDLAVHSLKDVPQSLPEGLILGPTPEREDPRDVFISRFGEQINELPRGSTVGTSSPRRQAQIQFLYKKRYRLEPIRGNVDTRLKKLSEGQYDALVMAAAGLKRLGLQSEITQILEPQEFMPAPCQGILGLELRQIDAAVLELLKGIKHEPSDIVARAERAFLLGIGGDCLVPLACHSILEKDSLRMEAKIWDSTAEHEVVAKETGSAQQPEYVGGMLAGRLLINGGAELMSAPPKAAS